MIHGEEERQGTVSGPGTHTGDIATTEPMHDRPAADARETQAGASREMPGGQGAAGTGAHHAAGQPGTSSVGRSPVQADGPQAGTTTEHGSGQRAADAITGAPPYVSPGEDLERVGATTGVAPDTTMGSWSDVSSRYRQRWQARSQQAGMEGGRWEAAEPGYRYGHEMASDPRYQGREWTDAESDLRSGYADWATRQGHRETQDQGLWDRLKEGARDAWDSVRGRATGGTTGTDDRPERQPGRAPGERGSPV